MRKQRWNAQDREAFATQRLRAQTIPAKRDDGPQADEWDDSIDGDPGDWD